MKMIEVRRFFMAIGATVLMLAAAGAAQASVLNIDPTAPDPMPTLGVGWVADEISAPFVPSDASPYTFTLAASAIFRITDQFVPGDTYFVYNGAVTPANLILTTVFNGPQAPLTPVGDPTGEAGWESGDYSHGQITLGPGTYALTVEGDGVGGTPAGFYTRLDSATVTPEPSTFAIMGLSGVAGLVFYRRRTRTA